MAKIGIFIKSSVTPFLLSRLICTAWMLPCSYGQGNFNFSVEEVERYTIPYKSGLCVLEMAYAQSKILNPQDWQAKDDIYKIKNVDLIFTKYPKKKQDWLTNYDTLLKKRIHRIRKLIPELQNDTTVRWRIILQTDCQSNEEAQSMFHGVVINYKAVLKDNLKEAFHNIRKIITGGMDFVDSVVFRTFERNQHWDSMLVVSDWTGSMYAYGTQVALWYRLNYKKKNIRHFVFFNDGDQKPDIHKKPGQTGGIYASRSNSLRGIINTMQNAMFHGNGGDKEENDVEALLFAIEHYPDFKDLILIADGHSAIRDIAMAQRIKVPVRVILCSLGNGEKIHPNYLYLAHITKGSVHTIEEDIENIDNLSLGEVLHISKQSYRYTGSTFQSEE